ncbi:hypothetical protein BJF91_23010 [Allorhizobium taibaishanense]|nr:hypothetical protein BJF91_23010 [Allorhizobium taibaishanense]
MLLAEQLNAFFPKGNYQDILTFEAHIAQISELIVLFSESFGSAAELGAFSMVPDIAHRLLVVIDDDHYNANSFISLGPIRALENKFDSSVCVLHRQDIGIQNIRNVADVKIDVLSEQMEAAIGARERSSKEHTTFDATRPGHIIKFIVGLIQSYGALTIDEIEAHLFSVDLNTSVDTLKNYLLCAEFADWIMQDKRGTKTYFSALDRKRAVQFESRKDREKFDKIRWHASVMEHWKATDSIRFSSIQAAMKRGRHD